MSAQPHSSHERRYWVRLTRCCNNRCLFCLDSEAQDGTFVAVEELKRQIGAGGGGRLVLSGGEPTIHPAYLDLVRHGKSSGYQWVQTITNGRMFSYPGFAHSAASAGLDELTISMHGHTAELHDRLVGIAGAFEQSSRGLSNALGLGLVVSVDVVLNRLNVPYLPDILRYFMKLGVREFDLLHLVPFGRAYHGHWGELDYDPAEFEGPIREALSLSRVDGVHLWTNRMPARFLEGYEHLIQSPEKLLDEVRGRAAEFGALVRDAKPLPCRDSRCGRCSVLGFCAFLDARLRGDWRPPQGVPPCAPSIPAPAPPGTDAPIADLEALARQYISDGHRVFGPRCDDCHLRAKCPGVTIETARTVGLAALVPPPVET